ncbi:MAG: hypothetical protein IPN86_18760 [Saprospiraceae bacterium]|nr:hypothetical protein [Saprospiraceae bacterium]
MKAYLTLFYYIGLPASICGLFVIGLQYFLKNKYIALSVSAVFLLATNTSIGKEIGLSHPLTRFANFLPDVYSDINGFGYFPKAFFVNISYSFSFALVSSILGIIFMNKSLKNINWKQGFVLIIPLVSMAFIGSYIVSKNDKFSKEEAIHWQQQYEEKYESYKTKPQPTVIDVSTTIDLFPEQNSYKVKGTYILANKTQSEISEILINTNKEITWNAITSSKLVLVNIDNEFGQYLFKTKQKTVPNDTITIHFDFEYQIEPLKGHQSFNAMVDNGTFIRISNYFPSIGYNLDHQIEDKEERKARKMPLLDPLTKVDAPLENPYNYQYINFDAIISTSAQQTAISIGELVEKNTKDNRNYFHYRANNIPFRFAVSSAKYAIQKSKYKDIEIEVLYEPKHYQNISHLMKSIKNTMLYCETNFENIRSKQFVLLK